MTHVTTHVTIHVAAQIQLSDPKRAHAERTDHMDREEGVGAGLVAFPAKCSCGESGSARVPSGCGCLWVCRGYRARRTAAARHDRGMSATHTVRAAAQRHETRTSRRRFVQSLMTRSRFPSLPTVWPAHIRNTSFRKLARRDLGPSICTDIASLRQWRPVISLADGSLSQWLGALTYMTRNG